MNTISLLFIISLFINGVFGDEVMTVMEGHSVTLHTDLTDMKRVIMITWRVGEEGSNKSPVSIADNEPSYNDTNEIFRGRLQVDNQTGDLTIKNMRVKHSGRYQAEINHINNNGTTYKNFSVTVYESSHFLDTCDVKSVSVMEGDSVTLHTDVQTHRDDLIVWRFGDEDVLIAKHDKEDNKSSIYDGEGFRDRLKMDDQTGSLIITNITATDAGVYKLMISSNNQTLCKTFYICVSVIITGQSSGVSPPNRLSLSLSLSLLVLVLLVLMAIAVYQYRHNIPCLRRIKALIGSPDLSIHGPPDPSHARQHLPHGHRISPESVSTPGQVPPRGLPPAGGAVDIIASPSLFSIKSIVFSPASESAVSVP